MSNASPSVLPLFNSPTSGEQFSQAATATTAQAMEEHVWEDESTPAGYPRLAEKMSRIPEIAIFRRFGILNAQNLLYLQAELVSMEKRLRKFQGQDSRSEIGNRKKYARNWYFLSQSRKDGNEKQWKLVRQIRQVLKEYNSAVLQQARILRMRPPGAYDMKYIQKYLETYEMGPLALTGRDSDIWGSTEHPESHADDLIALLPRHEEDFFSKFVTEKASTKILEVGSFLKYRRSGKERGLESLEDDTMLRWTRHATSILASVLPILSIIILYYVHSLEVRLGIIALFNIVLSLCLTVFTTAKKTEIFAVAAGFSAVQVVFVQVGTPG